MELLTYAFIALPFGLALLAALSVMTAVLLTSRLLARIEESSVLLILIAGLIFGMTISIAGSGRVIYPESGLPGSLGDDAVSGGVFSVRISQIFSLFVLCIAAGQLFKKLSARLPWPGRTFALWAVMSTLFVASVLVSGIVGVYRSPRFNNFYFVFVAAAIAMSADGIDQRFWSRLRLLIAIPLIGSLVAAIVAPSLVLQPGYAKTLIPGFQQRLFGLAEHANSLAPLAVIAMAIEFCPKVRLRPSVILVLVQFVVILLAQSKTAWIAAPLVLVIVRWQWWLSNFDGWRSRVVTILMAILLIVAATVLIAIVSQSSGFDKYARGSGIFTLTGRFALWSMTLDEFWRSPLFGYGPSIWDVQYRFERGATYAGQAHNQFIHILGQAGVFGFLAMIIYISALAWFALKGFRRDGGLALALLVILLLRCMTESPLRMMAIMDWENFSHIMLFCAASACAAKVAKPSVGRKWQAVREAVPH